MATGDDEHHAADADASAPSPHATRVESLFHLVREGSSAQVRENAAEKLGEIALQSPVYCKSILQQIRLLVVDSTWDVRVAAAKCVDVVAQSFQHPQPSTHNAVALRFAHASFAGREACCPRLNFRTVDMRVVLQDGAPLLRSGGEEYQYKSDLSGDQRRLQAVRQRQLLLRRICGASSDGMWKTSEDSLAHQMLPRLNVEHVKELAEDIEASESGVVDAKFKVATHEDDTKRKRTAGEMLHAQQQQPSLKKVKGEPTQETETETTEGDDEQKPLDLVALLVVDLFESIFDSKWQVRHGGLLALRHILLSSGWIQSLGRLSQTHEAMAQPSSSVVVDQWIEESLMRCLCVLSLDQFVDYSADGSVAPVRELCAQVFGILLGSLHDHKLLEEYLAVLRTLLTSGSSWHASHGGLLGMKYLIQAHQAHAVRLVPMVIHDVVQKLHINKQTDAEEDVVIVAASILGEIAPFLDAVDPKIIQDAWQALWRIVTMTSTTSRTSSSGGGGSGGLVASTTIETLRRWYAQKPRGYVPPASAMWVNLVHVVPLLHHHGNSVRIAAASCIDAIYSSMTLQGKTTENPTVVPAGLHQYLLPHVLLQLLREECDDVRCVLSSCWTAIITWCAATDSLVEAAKTQLPQWITLLWSFENVRGLATATPLLPFSDPATSTATRATTVDEDISLPSKDNLSARVAFADAMGMLASCVPMESSAHRLLKSSVGAALASLSGDQQCGALLLLSRWAYHAKAKKSDQLIKCLQDHFRGPLDELARNDWVVAIASPGSLFYSEQVASLQRVKRMQANLAAIFATSGVHNLPTLPTSSTSSSVAALSRQIAETIASYPYDALKTHHSQAFEQAHFRRQDLFLVDDVVQQAFHKTYARVQGLGSCVYCELLEIPPKKSGFLVKSLMESIKNEQNEVFQAMTADAIAHFVTTQVDLQRKCVTKIISNLCNSAVALAVAGNNSSSPQNPELLQDRDGLLTNGGDGDPVLHKLRVRVRGAELALQAIVRTVGHFDHVPMLAQIVTRGWSDSGLVKRTDKLVQENRQLVMVLAPVLSSGNDEQHHTAMRWLVELSDLVGEPFDAEEPTRRVVARAVAVVCKTLVVHGSQDQGENAMVVVYSKLFSSSGDLNDDKENESTRLAGAIMVLDRLVAELDASLTPYVPNLLRFAMQSMHASASHVRCLAAKAFADLVPLLPLQMDLTTADSSSNPQLQRVMLLEENESSRGFLERLLQGKAIDQVDMNDLLAKPFTLREYQQHGVNWLAFLAENRMGGVLADDMGLGKTIQVLAAIAAHSVKTKKRDSHHHHHQSMSLIVCPPIIVHHWLAEAARCFPGVFSEIVDYSGPAAARKAALRAAIEPTPTKPLLVVTTYAVVRADRETLHSMAFEFVVLDEAHLIRNPKSALFDAVCGLPSSYRFALSGTPLQNHVGDLWSLFHFLMPGYLGEYRDFRTQFELPISRSRQRQATPTQKELAALAINNLHQRVLPFLLRRTKDQVLKELPPKIISNIFLPLTKLQQRMYHAASSTANTEAPALAGVLQSLHVLKKICVHPALAKDQCATAVGASGKSLSDWKQSGKMLGLHDLLVESCDLGRRGASPSDESGDGDGDDTGSSHRCLVFGHMKETLDLIQEMLARALPRVTYLRLDGATSPASKRHEIVTKFNRDPSIDLLLLTTAVGGLGLTLTGADTVIFVEHSWNPFVDLQAMDRAHRIGQKKTVRVFRLIMAATIEEHIMDLQKFKERVASTVVATTDASSSMNATTKNVLQLLQTSSTAVKAQEAATAVTAAESQQPGIPGIAVGILDQLGEMWDQSQYDSLAFPGNNSITQ